MALEGKFLFSLPGLQQGIQSRTGSSEVAIVGDGTRSLALGSILSLAGHNVRLWSPEGLAPVECEIRQRKARVGHIRGKTRFATVTQEISEAIKGSNCLLIKSPATEYGAIADLLGSHLLNGQTVILANAPLGAALQFSKQLGQRRSNLQVNILEIGRMFDSLKIEGNVVLAYGPRPRISVCGLTRNETHRGLALASGLWMGLLPASNVLERGFLEVERVLRPALCLFRLLSFGAAPVSKMTAGLSAILAGMDAEVQSVAKSFGLAIPGCQQVLLDYCGANGKNLSEQIAGLGEVIKSDETRAHDVDTAEELARDVAETIVLIESFARLSRVPVPILESMINLASAVTRRDLRKEGRSLDDLGLVGFDAAEVIEAINL